MADEFFEFTASYSSATVQEKILYAARLEYNVT